MIRIPFLPMPYKTAKKYIRFFLPFGSALRKMFSTLQRDLEIARVEITATEYIAAAIFTATLYLVFLILFQVLIFSRNLRNEEPARLIITIFLYSLAFSFAIFIYIMLVPRWLKDRVKNDIEKNLLFATRHLMIQTAAGVPLYDAIVSISQEYENEKFNYGEISKEFSIIVKEVKGGKELTEALEDSASRINSLYYRRLMWQLANANKSGANIDTVLRNMVDFLIKEQEIAMRNYGAQLNPLAMFYMMSCIIAPTMGLILIAIISSLVDINVTPAFFIGILAIIIVVQFMFLGMLKSKRPSVAI